MTGPKRELTLVDAIYVTMGVIIGAGIYSVANQIAGAVSSSGYLILLWALGGLLSLMGALCYAELAAAYPQAGGDYVYLSRAYGPWAGFLFGWCQFTVVRPGDIATIALVFAAHATSFLPSALVEQSDLDWKRVLASLAIVVLTSIHMIGVLGSKRTQTALTIAKIVGIVLVIGLALMSPHESVHPKGDPPSDPLKWQVALVLVMFCYGGWNEMSYLAGEIRNPQRNVLRGLLVGILAVTAIYLMLNFAFLHVLGKQGLAASQRVAADAVSYMLPKAGGPFINVIICVSTLGTVNAMIFGGSRVSYAIGRDYRVFRWLGKWAEAGTPRRALALQGALALALILIFGAEVETIVITSVAVYTFYAFTSLAVIVLRFRDRKTVRPYRVTAYPITVLVFVGVSLWLLYSSIDYKPLAALGIGGVAIVGLVVYWLQKFLVRSPQNVSDDEAVIPPI